MRDSAWSRPAIQWGLIVLVLAYSVAWAAIDLRHYAEPGDELEPFMDALTYQAAGERLNSGHDLYRLEDGDRVLPMMNVVGGPPLVSPPPIGIVWQPLAAVSWGMPLWIASCWIVLLGSLVFVIRRLGYLGVALGLILAPSIGEQLAVANAYAFFPAMYLVAWHARNRPISGSLIGVACAVKLAPAVLFGWLIGSRRWMNALWAGSAFAALLAIAGFLAGWSTYGEYVSSVGASTPSVWSISHLTGIPGSSYAVLAGGLLVALLLGSRWERLSFAVAVTASVLGTPALYFGSAVVLLGACAPWTDPGFAQERTNSWIRGRVKPASMGS